MNDKDELYDKIIRIEEAEASLRYKKFTAQLELLGLTGWDIRDVSYTTTFTLGDVTFMDIDAAVNYEMYNRE